MVQEDQTKESAKYRGSWSAPGSAERNAEPIAKALAALVSKETKASAVVLEVASGFGHQISAAAREIPDITFQPSEADGYLCSQIDQRCSGLSNVRKAETLDLLDQNDWSALIHNVGSETPASDGKEGLFDGVLACNLTHITPWKVTESLFSHLDPRLSYITQQGQQRMLKLTGWVALYGAFNEDGRHTSPGNEKFDADIRSRDPNFGLRDIQNELIPLAQRHGYELKERIEMPAGNLMLVFRLREE